MTSRALWSIGLLVALADAGHAAGPGKGKTITVSMAGASVANGASFAPSISENGRFVAFLSSATNLSVPPGNGNTQVLVFDRKHGTIELVSRNGLFPADDNCGAPSISADGRHVVFYSLATNLVPGANGKTQVYRFDRKAETIARVSDPATIAVSANQNCLLSPGAVSANGRYVVFLSTATNLTSAGGNGKPQAYRRDMKTGLIDLVSATPGGAPGGSDSYDVHVADGGRLVAFASGANDLTSDDQNSSIDVFVRDVKKGVTKLVSQTKSGIAANGACFSAAISGNGRFVAFTSSANSLVAGDANFAADAFVVDRKTGKIKRYSVELPSENWSVTLVSLSRTGAKLACDVYDDNVPAFPPDDLGRAYLFDRKSGKAAEVTVDSAGDDAPTPTSSSSAQVSGNGKYIAFHSGSADLGADQDAQFDVFLRQRK